MLHVASSTYNEHTQFNIAPLLLLLLFARQFHCCFYAFGEFARGSQEASGSRVCCTSKLFANSTSILQIFRVACCLCVYALLIFILHCCLTLWFSHCCCNCCCAACVHLLLAESEFSALRDTRETIEVVATACWRQWLEEPNKSFVVNRV